MSTLRYGPHPDQFAQYWPAPDHENTRPLLMLVHGGYWRRRYDLTHMESIANSLAHAGWPVLNVEYRRAPGTAHSTSEDLQTALRCLPPLAAPRVADVVAVGFSAGGQLALWLAAQRASTDAGLRAALALAPVADLQRARDLHLSHDAVDEWLGGHHVAVAPFDPCLLPTPAMPVTLIHGAADEDVPPELSHRYGLRHPRARVDFLPATGHFDLIEPSGAAWPHVCAAIAAAAAPR